MRTCRPALWLAGLTLLGIPSRAPAEPALADDDRVFALAIRPVLEAECFPLPLGRGREGQGRPDLPRLGA